ncbi:MAG TPA: 50S ribosomal protein L15 [Bacteroidetes bacterium]|nr:50S ribosomal protein L15 [Bacteroidota bacterium]
MDLAHLTYAKNSRKKEKRLGRGPGSGWGKTAGKGANGQRSRSGSKRRAWFEGGQMPIQRRLPKRGFTNIFRKEYQPVNLKDLAGVGDLDSINPDILYEKGLVSKKRMPIKILGDGEWRKSIEIEAHAFSKSAVEKIEAAGGKAIVI